MWRILALTLIWFIFEMRASRNSLKISLENLNLTYYNEQFVEIHEVSIVAVSKRTNKIRASGLSKYELTDNLQFHIAAYRISKTNKEYLIFRGSRTVRLVLRLAETEFATDLRSHFIPDLYWPIKPNVTYTLRDWWLEHSQSPFELPTGRLKAIGTIKYPNNTILGVAAAVVNIFNSAENFD